MLIVKSYYQPVVALNNLLFYISKIHCVGHVLAISTDKRTK